MNIPDLWLKKAALFFDANASVHIPMLYTSLKVIIYQQQKKNPWNVSRISQEIEWNFIKNVKKLLLHIVILVLAESGIRRIFQLKVISQRILVLWTMLNQIDPVPIFYLGSWPRPGHTQVFPPEATLSQSISLLLKVVKSPDFTQSVCLM